MTSKQTESSPSTWQDMGAALMILYRVTWQKVALQWQLDNIIHCLELILLI